MSVYVFSILFSICFLWVVIDLMRRRVLREQYSMLWLLMGVVMLVMSTGRFWIERLAAFFGIYYAPSLLFLIGFLFLIAVILHLTIVVSRLTERMIRLTQELAITQSELHDKLNQTTSSDSAT